MAPVPELLALAERMLAARLRTWALAVEALWTRPAVKPLPLSATTFQAASRKAAACQFWVKLGT